MTVYALGSGVQASPGRIGRMRMSNRARTQAEMSAQFLAGVPEADRGASNALVGATWTNQASFLFDTLTTSGLNVTSAISDGTGLSIAYLSALTTGVRYRLDVSLTGTFSGVQLSTGAASTLGTTVTTFSTSGKFIYEFTASASLLYVGFRCPDLTACNFSATVTLVVAGLTADYAPSAIQLAPGQWHDGANKKHFHVPDGFRLGNPATDGKVYGKNTWAAADTLQYVTGVNAPVLPLNSVMTLYAKATVSGTFDLGDGVDQDRFGVGVTIGTTWAPVTLALPTHDGTNRDLTIKPTASYTGTVDTAWLVEVAA